MKSARVLDRVSILTGATGALIGAVALAGAAAGQWRSDRTVLGSYQQADAETVRQVVLHPTHRVMRR